MSNKSYKDDQDLQKVLENRPKVTISKIMQLKRANPHMMYAGVRIDHEFDPNGTVLEEYLNNNWEYVIDQELDDDYRSKKTEEKSYKPSPLVERGRGGAIFCYVCKTKEQWRKDELARKKRDEQIFLDDKPGRKVTRDGNSMSIQDQVLDENDINKQQSNND